MLLNTHDKFESGKNVSEPKDMIFRENLKEKKKNKIKRLIQIIGVCIL